jgi:hypothetical protein
MEKRTRDLRLAGRDAVSLGELIHEAVRKTIEQAVEEELPATLGAAPYQRRAERKKCTVKNISNGIALVGLVSLLGCGGGGGGKGGGSVITACDTGTCPYALRTRRSASSI